MIRVRIILWKIIYILLAIHSNLKLKHPPFAWHALIIHVKHTVTHDAHPNLLWETPGLHCTYFLQVRIMRGCLQCFRRLQWALETQKSLSWTTTRNTFFQSRAQNVHSTSRWRRERFLVAFLKSCAVLTALTNFPLLWHANHSKLSNKIAISLKWILPFQNEDTRASYLWSI